MWSHNIESNMESVIYGVREGGLLGRVLPKRKTGINVLYLVKEGCL
jgi:hypothetical protein